MRHWGTQRAIGHLEIRRVLEGHSGTRALKSLRHFGTERAFGHLDTRSVLEGRSGI